MVQKRENIQWAAVARTEMPCRGQRRMGRLVRDDRKVTVTQITTRYNQGMQNTISERTTRWTLKQMGSSSRRPHRVPLLAAKNRKRRLQFTQAHQYWTIISTNWALFKRHSLPEYCCCSYSVVRHNWNFKWDWLLWSDVTKQIVFLQHRLKMGLMNTGIKSTQCVQLKILLYFFYIVGLYFFWKSWIYVTLPVKSQLT